MLVVNASNKEKDLAHVLRYKGASTARWTT
jgi:hypothetical protein